MSLQIFFQWHSEFHHLLMHNSLHKVWLSCGIWGQKWNCIIWNSQFFSCKNQFKLSKILQIKIAKNRDIKIIQIIDKLMELKAKKITYNISDSSTVSKSTSWNTSRSLTINPIRSHIGFR